MMGVKKTFKTFFLFALLSVILAGPAAQAAMEEGDDDDRPRIAAICTIYLPFLHADVIVSKFILGFPTDEGIKEPQVDIVSLYLDQGPDDSLGHQLGEKFDIPVYPTIEEALTLGGDELAVDGVLLIGEHGAYPKNRYGQTMYPRMLMMKEILRVLEYSERAVPVFNDKQLSYNHLDAQWMYDRAREMGVPMMAGSVIPLIWRDPPDFKHPVGAEIEEAVLLFHGGVDRYAIHGFELLQSQLERRKGGETGVRSIKTLQGEAFDEALKDGTIPVDLVDEALENHLGYTLAERPVREYAKDDATAYLVEYLDGTRATMVQLNHYYADKWYESSRWLYAVRTKKGVKTCEFGLRSEYSPGMRQPVPAFSYQGLNIQEMFLTGQPQYPVERTLLTSGMSEAAIRSVYYERPIETPHLDIQYEPYDFEPIRPTAPTPSGASVEPWPEEEELRPLFEWRGSQ
ncbi:MAG: hypothetical protein ACOCUY_02165 [Verrucomicrobiota bacterium]